jgi:16S rRNA (guanine966-N2)-methyltransferase
VTDDTWIIVEAELLEDFSFSASFGFEVIREKTYKTNKHVFLKRRQHS